MKRIATTLVLITLFYSIISSQTYYPFPESDAHWQYSYLDIPMFCHCFCICQVDQYKISGDTVINSITYHKLVQSQMFYQYFCIEMFYNLGYKGAFRNEVEEKKVWYVPPGEESEVLLYDFSLQLGDTLPASYIIPEQMYYVEGIDSVEIGDSYRKKYVIKSIDQFELPKSIIEGIGGDHFFEEITMWFNGESGYFFNCVNIGDSLGYPAGGSCDEIIVSSKDVIYDSDFHIFPNPSTGKFWIKHSSNNQEFISIEIFNSYGEKLKQFEATQLLSPIDLYSSPKGIYMIMIKFESGTFTQKIIIQ